MYFAYVIQCINFPDYFYKGHCENLEVRLKQHNSLKTKSNKHYAPFRIVYFEPFDTRDQAILKEKYWKTGAGRRYLQKILITVP
ncbi:GIY-YIG nuclease family protein [Pinibacter aurantiacus]|uniref:GIY-YIG nuclease family protein n=1 Tax=Pinibacter aurantiacus TaxID=2851599 RepID=A0A9E2W1N7_9BACT|nr:GIY-YIG nuclease family protein [Pinibacter aurantiacus]